MGSTTTSLPTKLFRFVWLYFVILNYLRPVFTYTVYDNKYHVANDTNIIFVKAPKTGGSTFGGVLRRIGAHHHLSGYQDAFWIMKEPGVFANHVTYNELSPLLEQLTHPIYLVTMVREPADRAISQYFRLQMWV